MQITLDQQLIGSESNISATNALETRKSNQMPVSFSTIKFPSKKSQVDVSLTKKKRKLNKNDIPDILRNMPSGLFTLFGTGDNSVLRFKSKRNNSKINNNNKTHASIPQISAGMIDSAAFGPNQPSLQVDPVCQPNLQDNKDNAPQSNIFTGTHMFNHEYYSNEGSQKLSSTNVYVGGIPRHYTERELHAVFKAYGPISSVYITRIGTVAFIQFEKSEDANKAIAAQHQTIPPTGS